MMHHASGVIVGELSCCVVLQWVLGMCLTCHVLFGNTGEVVRVVVTRQMRGA